MLPKRVGALGCGPFRSRTEPGEAASTNLPSWSGPVYRTNIDLKSTRLIRLKRQPASIGRETGMGLIEFGYDEGFLMDASSLTEVESFVQASFVDEVILLRVDFSVCVSSATLSAAVLSSPGWRAHDLELLLPRHSPLFPTTEVPS